MEIFRMLRVLCAFMVVKEANAVKNVSLWFKITILRLR